MQHTNEQYMRDETMQIVLKEVVRHPNFDPTNSEDIAETTWDIVDAIMAERAKRYTDEPEKA